MVAAASERRFERGGLLEVEAHRLDAGNVYALRIARPATHRHAATGERARGHGALNVRVDGEKSFQLNTFGGDHLVVRERRIATHQTEVAALREADRLVVDVQVVGAPAAHLERRADVPVRARARCGVEPDRPARRHWLRGPGASASLES